MAHARIANVHAVEREHGKAHAEDLTGAEMTVCAFRFCEQVVERGAFLGWHRLSV
jgi:hypothetical protein